jgi:hypothetical protein
LIRNDKRYANGVLRSKERETLFREYCATLDDERRDGDADTRRREVACAVCLVLCVLLLFGAREIRCLICVCGFLGATTIGARARALGR